MKNTRTPSIFMIEGTSFEVDIDQQVLRQTNDRSNEISFIKDMTDLGTHYRLFYDTGRKNIPRDTYDSENHREISVPQLIELDPAGMAEKYQLPISQLKGKTDFEVIVDQEALARRQQGVLPRISIAGEDFIIDLHLQELRHAQNFHPVISLESFDLTPEGRTYEAYYHPVIKQVVQIDPKLTEFPDGVVKIQIPNAIGLDPVAAAKAYRINERELLRRCPIQKNLKAEVFPLSETHIPALIQRNREQLRKAHEEITRRIRPKQRPRF